MPTVLAALAATRFAPLSAPAAYVLLCYLPGRLVVTGFGLGSGWDASGRVLLSGAMSLAVMPVLLNPVWHVTNSALWLLLFTWGVLTVGYVVVATFGRAGTRAATGRAGTRAATGRAGRGGAMDGAAQEPLFSHRRTGILAGVIVVLIVFAAVGTYWPTEPRGYPVPAWIHDFAKHHAIFLSLEHRPLPLGNIFYAEEAAGPVYYYHFFYLIPATVRALAPSMSIELIFGIQAAWVGILTAGMFYLVVKRFTRGDGPASLAALLATAVSGFDVIPLVARGTPAILLDAWADTLIRIHNLLTQVVWTPQNVVGVLISLVALYILSVKGWWRGWFILGPVLANSLIGSTVWVAAGLLPAVAVVVVWQTVVLRRDSAAALRLLACSIGVALLMVVVSLPQLDGYLEMSQRHGKGLTAEWPYQRNAYFGRLAPPGVLANLLDLPWVLLLEFGPLLVFPLLVSRRVWRRAWDDLGLRLLLVSACLGLLGFVTVRSHFTYNDFGQKIILLTMSAGIVLGACVVAPNYGRPRLLNPLGWSLPDGVPRRWRGTMGVAIGLVMLLGLPVGLFQTPLSTLRRCAPPSAAKQSLAGSIAYLAGEEAALGNFLRRHMPAEAVLQGDWTTVRVPLVQIARRQIGVTELEQDTMVFYPVDEAAHARTLAEVSEVLAEPVAAESCNDVLRAHQITHVIVGTIERKTWRGLEKFADERYFECVFSGDGCAVYALR